MAKSLSGVNLCTELYTITSLIKTSEITLTLSIMSFWRSIEVESLLWFRRKNNYKKHYTFLNTFLPSRNLTVPSMIVLSSAILLDREARAQVQTTTRAADGGGALASRPSLSRCWPLYLETLRISRRWCDPSETKDLFNK